MTNTPTRSAGTNSDILLDAGTNELEVLVFGLAGGQFGVNVAKVREVIRGLEPTESPHMHKSVLGMFNMRGTLMPLVDLGLHMGLNEGARGSSAEDLETKRIIVTEFNGRQTGFLVDDVDQIRRMSWQSVRPVPDLASLGRAQRKAAASCTGVLEVNESLVLMLDFESIADAIVYEDKLHVTEVPNTLGVDRGAYRVVLAEDSAFMRERMSETLKTSGYAQLQVFADGSEAWQALSRETEPGSVACIISDIEMPQMDGLHLCKRCKEHPALASTPVVLFSSLISNDNRNKGEQVGADIQVPKPELPEMVRLVDLAVMGRLDEVRSSAKMPKAA